MTTDPTPALHWYTALDPVRQTIGDVYAQVRADLLDHPNYRLDVFLERLERLDRHAAPNRAGRPSSPTSRRASPSGTPTGTPSAPVTGGGSA